MFEALSANGPDPDRASGMMLYGQFVGDWIGECIIYDSGQIKHKTQMEVHFDWILEGRAIQDVWIAPPLDDRKKSTFLTKINFYGTTIRMYDPKEDIWRILWVNPINQDINRMVGKKEGSNIVQEYRIGDNIIGQWIYSDIKKDSFHWIAQESTDGGKTWELEQEFLLNRRLN